MIHPDPALLANHHKIWVKYSPAVAAQFEKRFMQLNNMEVVDADAEDVAIDPIITVALDGRVVGNGEGAKYRGNHGLTYRVDCTRMVQINAKTGYERLVLRVETDLEDGPVVNEADLSDAGGIVEFTNVSIDTFTDRDGPGTAVTFNAARLDAREVTEDDMPQFPFDLIEAKEPMLLLQKGQLVQVQKKRDDGWSYGYVVWEPAKLADTKKDDRLSKRAARIYPMMEGVEESKNEYGQEESPEAQAPVKFTNMNDREEELGGETAGWFPSVFVRPPQLTELKEMQDAMGGAEAAENALAVPRHWSAASKNGKTTAVKKVKLQQGSTEYDEVQESFLSTMGSRNVRIKSVERIENVILWQSYAAKKSAMILRAKNEGLTKAQYDKYEKKKMFHGTSADTIPKIAQQGFNRSFCGRNATAFGKGVYFALTSNYSNSYAEGWGSKQMFVCRVLVGETSQGHSDQLVPKIRVKAENIMYDSTTDRMSSPEPADIGDPAATSGVRQMYVVYHDAQAYPEYLVNYA